MNKQISKSELGLVDTDKKLEYNDPSTHFWFRLTNDNQWAIQLKETKQTVGTVVETADALSIYLNDDMESYYDEVYSTYLKFRYRPEWMLCAVANGFNPTQLHQQLYDVLLQGALGVRFYIDNKDPDDGLKLSSQAISWLRSTDFYTAPASTKYHESFEHGLLTHTLKVVDNICKLQKSDPFKSVRVDSAILVALVHDWCKIGMYESYLRNVKNDKGVWEQVKAYTYKEERFIALGHGVSSMYLAIKFFPLTLPEICAIRWHMGEYNVADNEMNELHQCNEEYPIVQLLQFADRLSITKYSA